MGEYMGILVLHPQACCRSIRWMSLTRAHHGLHMLLMHGMGRKLEWLWVCSRLVWLSMSPLLGTSRLSGIGFAIPSGNFLHRPRRIGTIMLRRCLLKVSVQTSPTLTTPTLFLL